MRGRARKGRIVRSATTGSLPLPALDATLPICSERHHDRHKQQARLARPDECRHGARLP
jgi:hypothetical protein